MKAEPFIVTPGSLDRPLTVLGVQITPLAQNTATLGYEITLQAGDEHVGPPPHRHDWDETFYVLEGAVEINVEGEVTRCEKGALAHLPAGTVHGYRFCEGGGRMLEITGQGGQAIRMFSDLSQRIPPGPPDLPLVASALLEHGVTLAL
jgi:quercetin dioxygenase-like cupin family protein